MIQHNIVPARLALLREKAGLSQLQFASKISEIMGGEKQMTASIISMWETGRRKMPYKYMDVVTGIFNVTAAYLLGYTDDEKETENSVVKGDTDKIEISVEHLYKYDNRPVFVEFVNYTHENAWGIYDKDKNQIIFKDYIYRLKQGNNGWIRVYVIPPEYAIKYDVGNKKNLDMIKVLSYERVYIRMNTPDKAIRNLYDGWYHHNENHKCLINNMGLTLPYDGLNLAFTAYSMGDIDSSL